MKIVLPVAKRVPNVKLPPIFPPKIYKPLPDLTSGEWLDVIDQSKFDINQNIKDKIELASRTVRLSLNHGIEQTEQGQMYLVFFPPCFCDFPSNEVSMESENAGAFPIGPLVTFGGALWLVLPIGKRYALDFSVQSKKKNTFFHVGVRYKDFSDEFTIESKENGQHLTITVDTTKSGFYGIDIVNMQSDRKRLLRHKDWIFYNVTIVRLD